MVQAMLMLLGLTTVGAFFVAPPAASLSATHTHTRALAAARPTVAARSTRQILKATVQDAGRKPVLITGNNIDVTDALKEYVQKKVDKVLEKLGGVVTKVDVHLVVNKNPRVADSDIAEVTVFAKGTVIRATESSDSMYASIDAVTDTIARKLRKYKERNVAQKRSRTSVSDLSGQTDAKFEQEQAANSDGADDDEASAYDDGLPHVDMSVVKTKSFPMVPCSLEDAVTALEYIDHDFYVFRNAASGEVNVVYKRNSGGVGHIQPERD